MRERDGSTARSFENISTRHLHCRKMISPAALRVQAKGTLSAPRFLHVSAFRQRLTQAMHFTWCLLRTLMSSRYHHRSSNPMSTAAIATCSAASSNRPLLRPLPALQLVQSPAPIGHPRPVVQPAVLPTPTIRLPTLWQQQQPRFTPASCTIPVPNTIDTALRDRHALHIASTAAGGLTCRVSVKRERGETKTRRAGAPCPHLLSDFSR